MCPHWISINYKSVYSIYLYNQFFFCRKLTRNIWRNYGIYHEQRSEAYYYYYYYHHHHHHLNWLELELSYYLYSFVKLLSCVCVLVYWVVDCLLSRWTYHKLSWTKQYKLNIDKNVHFTNMSITVIVLLILLFLGVTLITSFAWVSACFLYICIYLMLLCCVSIRPYGCRANTQIMKNLVELNWIIIILITTTTIIIIIFTIIIIIIIIHIS
jgi:hypothetical protein